MNDKLVEVCGVCLGHARVPVHITEGQTIMFEPCICGKGRLGPGVAVAEGVDEAALLRHLEQFDKYSGSAHVHPAMLKQLQEFHASFHSRRGQLVEKLCAAVAEWLSDEADRVYKKEKYSDHSQSEVIESLSWRTAKDKNLADLLDRTLGEVK